MVSLLGERERIVGQRKQNRKSLGLAKLTPPTLPVVLKRPRLFRLLDKARKRPVTWMAAPAGSGKTTLVASYLKARRLSVLWYRLDESDADPPPSSIFWRSLPSPWRHEFEPRCRY